MKYMEHAISSIMVLFSTLRKIGTVSPMWSQQNVVHSVEADPSSSPCTKAMQGVLA